MVTVITSALLRTTHSTLCVLHSSRGRRNLRNTAAAKTNIGSVVHCVRTNKKGVHKRTNSLVIAAVYHIQEVPIRRSCFARTGSQQ